jgi:hypothetical protein
MELDAVSSSETSLFTCKTAQRRIMRVGCCCSVHVDGVRRYLRTAVTNGPNIDPSDICKHG